MQVQVGLKQRVNERRDARAGEENEGGKDQKSDDQGQEPPFLVLLHEAPQFAGKSSARLLGGSLLEFTLLLVHRPYIVNAIKVCKSMLNAAENTTSHREEFVWATNKWSDSAVVCGAKDRDRRLETAVPPV